MKMAGVTAILLAAAATFKPHQIVNAYCAMIVASSRLRSREILAGGLQAAGIPALANRGGCGGPQQTGVGGLVRNATDRCQSEIDGRGCVVALFEMNPVPEHYCAIKRQPWLGAVPAHELIDGVVVCSLAAQRRQ